jgi:nucleoside-diphosphate-sugar epimerase
LQGKTNLKNGDEFLHLAHRDDCVSAIAAIIEKNSWGQTFNIVSDLKSKKADYYPAMAKKLNLIEPVYENLSLPNPTQISSEKSKKILGLNYIDPRTFLPLK